MQPDRDDHGVRAPPVDFTHNAERNLFAKIADIDVGVFQRRTVVEHQQQSGERQNEKEKKSDTAHAPGVAHANAGLAHFHRMQVKKHASQHHQHAFAVRIRHTHTEDGPIDLTFLDVFANFRGR